MHLVLDALSFYHTSFAIEKNVGALRFLAITVVSCIFCGFFQCAFGVTAWLVDRPFMLYERCAGLSGGKASLMFYSIDSLWRIVVFSFIVLDNQRRPGSTRVWVNIWRVWKCLWFSFLESIHVPSWSFPFCALVLAHLLFPHSSLPTHLAGICSGYAMNCLQCLMVSTDATSDPIKHPSGTCKNALLSSVVIDLWTKNLNCALNPVCIFLLKSIFISRIYKVSKN